MKNSIKFVAAAVVVVSLLVGSARPAQAEHSRPSHRHQDGTGAAIVAGIAAVGVIAALASQHDRDRYVVREHCAPPPPPPQRWIPGHYETRHERVLVPGYWDTVTEPVRHHRGHGWGHYRHGCDRYVTRQVWVPERYEWRETRVWVPGHYELARAY